MIKNSIYLDKDMEKCKELYCKLKEIVDAYDMLPVYEKIHTHSGNKVLSTASMSNRQYNFAELFNDLIIEYINGEASAKEDDDDLLW